MGGKCFSPPNPTRQQLQKESLKEGGGGGGRGRERRWKQVRMSLDDQKQQKEEEEGMSSSFMSSTALAIIFVGSWRLFSGASVASALRPPVERRPLKPWIYPSLSPWSSPLTTKQKYPIRVLDSVSRVVMARSEFPVSLIDHLLGLSNN